VLLESMRTGDAPARRQLASYLSTGTWFDEVDGPEAAMLRELAADQDGVVVRDALLAVLRLTQRHPELALGIALDANIGTDPHLAEDLGMAVGHVTSPLSDDHARLLLNKLRPVKRLEHWAHQVLAKLALAHREDILDFLLDRASSGGDVKPLSFHDYDVDLVGGAQGDELLDLLRRVRNAVVGADTRHRWDLGHLYWRLTNDLNALLAILVEGIDAEDEAQVDATLSLLTDMPWPTVLTYPEVVEDALCRARARSADSFNKVHNAPLTTAVVTGRHRRTMGQPSPRDIRLRDEGRKCAERFGPASPSRRFFEDVVKRAEQSIRESALEDEEYPES
jgi:hypothetical protein